MYLLAAISYIGASLVWKGLLNWIIGPLWLIAIVALAQPWLRPRDEGP